MLSPATRTMNQRFCVNTFALYTTVSGTRTVPKAGGAEAMKVL